MTQAHTAGGGGQVLTQHLVTWCGKRMVNMTFAKGHHTQTWRTARNLKIFFHTLAVCPFITHYYFSDWGRRIYLRSIPGNTIIILAYRWFLYGSLVHYTSCLSVSPIQKHSSSSWFFKGWLWATLNRLTLFRLLMCGHYLICSDVCYWLAWLYMIFLMSLMYFVLKCRM